MTLRDTLGCRNSLNIDLRACCAPASLLGAQLPFLCMAALPGQGHLLLSALYFPWGKPISGVSQENLLESFLAALGSGNTLSEPPQDSPHPNFKIFNTWG